MNSQLKDFYSHRNEVVLIIDAFTEGHFKQTGVRVMQSFTRLHVTVWMLFVIFATFLICWNIQQTQQINYRECS